MDHFEKSKLENIDLIISCGDLEPTYLFFPCNLYVGPVVYVHGNHDTKYDKIPPEGCTCIDDKIFVYKGIRILGLGALCVTSLGISVYGKGYAKTDRKALV